jgi:hypothetical protein
MLGGMHYPRAFRCNAAFGSAVGGSAVAGAMALALVVALVFFRKPNIEATQVFFGVMYLVVVVIYMVVSMLALPCKIIVDRYDVTFIETFGRRRTFRWDQIWGFEVVDGWRTSQGRVIGMDGQRFEPMALQAYCLGGSKSGLAAPVSLRYTCDVLNYELHMRRGASAAG